MKVDILKRLQQLEKRANITEFPDLVLISYCKDVGRWEVKETYCKHDAKGNIVMGSGKDKAFYIADPDKYEPPEGFKGSIIVDFSEVDTDDLRVIVNRK